MRKEQAFGQLGLWASENGAASTQITITDPVAKKTTILNPDKKTARVLPAPPAPPAPPFPAGASTKESVIFERMTRSRAGSGGDGVSAESQVSVSREGERTVERRVEVSGDGKFATTTIPDGAPGAGPMRFTYAGAFHGIFDHKNVKTEDLGERTIQGVKTRGARTTTTIPTDAIGNDRPIVSVLEQWTSPELGVVVLRTLQDPQIGETVYRLENIDRGEPLKSLFEVPAGYEVKESQPRMRRIEIRKRSDGE